MSKQSKWLQFNGSNQANAECTLFCFHNVGGSAQIFKNWSKHLPPEIQVCAVQLPGRWERLGEPFYISAKEAVNAIFKEVQPHIKRPYAVLGYSMGAILGYELLRVIREQGGPVAKYFFPIGLNAPQLIKSRTNPTLLSDQDLLKFLIEVYDAIPEAVAKEPEMLQMLIPIFRADFQIAESYRYIQAPPLDVPIAAFAGTEDKIVRAEGLLGWKQHTSKNFSHSLVPGGHLFINPNNEKHFLDTLAKHLGFTSAKGQMR